MRILPALNIAPGDEAALIARLAAVPEADTFHLDVCDGTMTPNATWADAVRWRELAGTRQVQVHLMVNEPETIIGSWLEAGAKEIIVHLEPIAFPAGEAETAVVRLAALRADCQKYGARLILGGSPFLPARTLATYKAYGDGFLVLAVTPGRAGQPMEEISLATVKSLREQFPDDLIWVDGGVNTGTIPAIRGAGASAAVAASAVFDAPDPAAALAALQSI